MRRAVLLGAGVLLVVLVAFLGYRYYDTNLHFVSTENASVSGDLVGVSSTNGGRVSSVAVDIGDVVKKGQSVGSVEVSAPSTLGLGPGGSGPVQGTKITSDLTTPVNGVVVAKPAAVGDMVAPGQPVLLVVDLGQLWVTANVDEGKIS